MFFLRLKLDPCSDNNLLSFKGAATVYTSPFEFDSSTSNVMKTVIVIACFVALGAAKVFHLKDDHYAKYHMVIDAVSNDQKIHHEADFLVTKGEEEEEFRCKVKNVEIDKLLHEQFDHSDVVEITKQELVFSFDDMGCIEFKKPEDLEEPHMIVYEPKLIEMIQKGTFEFKKMIFVPYSTKKCKATFKITELDDAYDVQITPQDKCIVSPFMLRIQRFLLILPFSESPNGWNCHYHA